MCGTYRSSATGATYIYYKCPHDPANPRHAAAYPDHGTVALPEALIMAAIGTFFDQYVFGHDRAALLAAQLPATDAEHAEARERQEAHLRAELGRIDIAERALISELETPADPGDPATQAYPTRIRARYAELCDQRTRTETQLKTLQAAAPDDSDPDLLVALPIASAVFTDAPARIKEALLAAFDISVLYRHDLGQVTIRAALTGDTPRTIAALLDDPRTGSDTSSRAPGQDPFDHSSPAPIRGTAIRDDA
jgi:hypothetical protein